MADRAEATYRSGMAKWGQKVDSPFVRKPDVTKPGWRDDPERPGIERYWTGDRWDDEIAPRPKPEPAWKGARVIALGILIACAVIFVFWKMSQPTAADCLDQSLEVLNGTRVAVEDACR